MTRQYEDDQQEKASIMAWTDRRLEFASVMSLPIYVAAFKKMWMDSFGTYDNIPIEYKAKVREQYNALKLQQLAYEQLRGES